MSEPQDVRVTANPNSSWFNKANQAIRSNNLVHSPDLLFEKSTRGTSIKLHPKHKYIISGVTYSTSSYDFSSSYNAFTIQVVSPASITSLSGAITGTYISNRNIPSLAYYNAIVAGGYLTGSDLDIYQRDPTISYVPGSGSTNAWDLLGSGGGSNPTTERYKITDTFSGTPKDFFSASKFDPSSGGIFIGTYIVAIQPQNRPSNTHPLLLGLPITMSYLTNNFRTTTINGITQTEQLLWPYQTNDIFFGSQLANPDTSVASGSVGSYPTVADVTNRNWGLIKIS